MRDKKSFSLSAIWTLRSQLESGAPVAGQATTPRGKKIASDVCNAIALQIRAKIQSRGYRWVGKNAPRLAPQDKNAPDKKGEVTGSRHFPYREVVAADESLGRNPESWELRARAWLAVGGEQATFAVPGEYAPPTKAHLHMISRSAS